MSDIEENITQNKYSFVIKHVGYELCYLCIFIFITICLILQLINYVICDILY